MPSARRTQDQKPGRKTRLLRELKREMQKYLAVEIDEQYAHAALHALEVIREGEA